MYWNIGPDSEQGTWAPNCRKTYWGSVLQVGLSQFDKSWVKRDFLSQINVGNAGSRKVQGFLLKDFWDINLLIMYEGFPHSSVGKESTCNAGDPSSIPGSERSPGKEIGYPLQYSWVSLVVWLVKNPPAMWETWVWSLGWEDPLEKGKATHSSILAWRIPWAV